MAEVNILYKIYLDEDEGNKNIINEKPYYYMKKEDQKEITQEILKNYLIEDGYNSGYFELISKYKIQLKNEKDEELKENENGAYILEEKGHYKLYLDLVIDKAKEEARIKKEQEKEKENEKNEYELQLSNVNQITNEVNDIKRQMNYLQKDIKNEQNEVITWIKKNLYINKKILSDIEEKKNKTMIKSSKKQEPMIQDNVNMTSILVSKDKVNNDTNRNISSETQEKEINDKIIYLFSRFKRKENVKDILIQENDPKEKDNLLEEDYSFYQQILNINNIIKNKKEIYVDLKLKQIKESLFLEENPNILHLRVDSFIKDDNKIYFNWENTNYEYHEYSLDTLMISLKEYRKINNLKLLIISSQNIKEIKKNFDTLNNLKNINKIYINHSKLTEIEENNLINYIYNNFIIEKKTIRNSIPNNNKYKAKDLFILDIKKDEKCFVYKNNIPEPEQESKNLLSIEMMENNYCLIGRREELNQCLSKLRNGEKRLCIYGPKGVGKKSFVKKVGFSVIERNIFNKAYYLEINLVDFSNLEMKLNILIDEIDGYCSKDTKKVLLIIYFNEPISLIYDLKEFIHYCGSIKKGFQITYIFTFTLDNSNIKEYQNEYTDDLILTHFQNYNNDGKIIQNFKDLFNFCVKERKIESKNLKNIIGTVNKMFDDLTKDPNEKEIRTSLEVNNRSGQTSIIMNKDSLNEETINSGKKNNLIYNSIKFEPNNNKQKEEILKGAKINNIFLLSIYLNFCKDIDIKTVFNQLINDDDEQIKKQIISTIMKSEGDNKKNIDYIYEIFLYLNKLVYGVGKSTLKMLLQDKSETKINFIKEKLYGLIIVEYYMEEEIFRLDSSFKYLIEQIINNDRNLMIFNNIFKNYFKCFRKLLGEDKIKGGFHACIKNNFWFNVEMEKQFDENKNEINSPKFICDIDSNNIYHFIKNNSNDIYADIDIRAYIDDISISLPTLLYFTNNFYFEYLIIDVFEKFYGNLKAKENTLKINELILRLGIFKYWVSKNPSFFEKSLKAAGITDKLNINLNDDAKFEFYLSKIYDCIIKKDRNIEEFHYECRKILQNKNDKANELNEERLKKLLELAIIKIDKDPRNKFFFLLSNPLKNKELKEFKTMLNGNFYLTQKLLTKIPSNFGLEFKILEEDEIRKFNLISFFNNSDKNNSININFLYLSNESLKKKVFESFKNANSQNHIKILILGYLGSEENFEKEIKDISKKINHIIYISKNDTINFKENVKNYNNKSYYYYFELYFIQFVHEFVSFITSKYEYCSINDAFMKAKRNFVTKFERLFESEDLTENDDLKKEQLNQKKDYKKLISSIESLIKIKSEIDDDFFEIENIDEEENLNNHQKVINDIYDEYEFEYNKIKNIYYRKNPFTEETESQLKKGKYKKYMKLPGIENLSPKNFKYFVEKEIYDVVDEVSILEKKILNNNLVNIYGKDYVFDLGDELCKYFYMAGNFENGIYIVSPRNIEEEKDWLIEKIKLKGNTDDQELSNILILLKLLNINDKDINIGEIKKLASLLVTKTNIHIVVCSEVEFEPLLNCEKCDLKKLK